ncbi:DUF935 family protein [uncultured Muribaculum sp.]|uniref:phage portal protein family protein n=1 Tax=uncultured Muribaculum sp. TaxID=1918613 RepID=UPI0025B375C9|nr:DUF935 family protein [uncultured Muribaculum sp.]
MSKDKKTTKSKQNAGNNAQQGIVLQNIIIKAPTRKVYDVGDWRTALRSADSGRVKQLYDLFDDLMVDGVLSDAVQRRIDAVTNSDLKFINSAGEEVDDMTRIIDSMAWEALLVEIMRCKFYGRSGAELTFNADGALETIPIPAKHINLKNKCILINDSDDTGIPYEGADNILILGKERDFGVLLKATPYAIYKRGGFGDWSQWVELFGQPQRIGKYNTFDPESRKLLEDAFEHAGGAPYVVIPKEAEVETHDTSSSNGSSFNEFRQACNEEILITVSGQTLTAVSGERGARSLGEVHQDVEDAKNRSDLRFVQRVLNQHVIPILERRGLPVADGHFVFPKSAEPLTVNEIVQLSDIMEIPQSHLREKYSIPAPEEGEPIARRQHQSAPMQLDLDADDDDTDDDDDKKVVKNADAGIMSKLRDFFAGAPVEGASDGTSHMTLSDDTLNDRVIKRVATGESRKFDAELFKYISDDLLKGIYTVFNNRINNVDYDYSATDDAFVTALEQNIYHFSASKTLAEVRQLNQALREAKTYDDFRKRADKVCDTFNTRWQKTEYDTAILAAESASNYVRLSRKKNLFPFWKYITVGDDKVRRDHAKLNGIVLPSEDPRWDKIFPPNDWNCRCRVGGVMRHEVTAELLDASKTVVDDFMDSAEWARAKAQHWDINRGKRSEIFTADQMYIKKFPNVAHKVMDKISPATWGAESSFKKLMGDSCPEFKPYTGTADDYWATHRTTVNGKEMLPVTDYAGRTWYMPQKDFINHSTDKKKKRAFRVGYISCITEATKTPDEVWLTHEGKDTQGNESRLNNWIMIKYYKGLAMACVCKIENSSLSFKSWYVLRDPSRIRRGILIYKK